MTVLSIAPQPGEPLAAWFSPERRLPFGREQRFECASFGDRVSGHHWLPERPPAGLVLAVHDLERSARDAALLEAARVWLRAGWACAAIDLPLHGERYNAKLSRRAVAAAASDRSADRALWDGLLAQALRDLARALDALASQRELPPVVGVAFGGAAPIALAHASLDPRVRRVSALGAPRPIPQELAALAAKPLAWISRADDLSLAP
ncbi:MAG TPA: hypothetical protein VII78_06260 [Myxococcota bacterium]